MRPLIVFFLFTVCISSCSNCRKVFVQDISPNLANGETQYHACTAGLTAELAGNDHELYAVSLNAGIFKSVDGGAWTQLENSPRYTTTLTVDPKNRNHLLAGERNGDADPVVLNRSGAWESWDAGTTWNLICNTSRIAGCRDAASQAVPAVFISPTTQTMFIGTPCGVGRFIKGAPEFDFSSSPNGIGAVKAFSVSQTTDGKALLWARADGGVNNVTSIIWSDNDGASWNVVSVPKTVDGFEIGFPDRGGDFSILSYGQTTVLDFRPGPSTDPEKWTTGESNYCTLLYYFKDANRFNVQALENQGDGVGLGGRKRLRTFVSTVQVDNALNVSGQYLHLYYIAGQDLLLAKNINSETGMLEWDHQARGRCAKCGSDENIHADLWDVNYSTYHEVVRLASDGGVYKKQGDNWVTHNSGLHTHHIHSLSVLPTQFEPRLAYVVTDNSEWYRDSKPFNPSHDWSTYGTLGDGSWTAADQGGPSVAMLVRHSKLSIFTDFQLGMPSGAGKSANSGFTAFCAPNAAGNDCADFTSFSPSTFKVIQTPLSQTASPLLDVVMLVSAPIQRKDGGQVVPISSGPLAQVVSITGGPLLIRNRQYLKHPDLSGSQYDDWELVSNKVPAGANRLWVANGHGSPVYYVSAIDAAGVVSIYRKQASYDWTKLNQIGAKVLNIYSTNGPLYVNPYNPDHIFIITEDGIRIPNKNVGAEVGAQTPFEVDNVLTALLTNSGEFPLTLSFGGGNGKDIIHASQADSFPKPILGDVGFNRSESNERVFAAVVASPVTGVFYQEGINRAWKSLTPYLPKPFTMPSCVGMDASYVYVGTEGRGIFRLGFCKNAKLASYFDRSNPRGDDDVAHLLSAASLPIVGAKVRVARVLNGIASLSTETTGSFGEINMTSADGDVIRLYFDGDDDYAPCETHFIRRIAATKKQPDR